jgi:hypothetical protein
MALQRMERSLQDEAATYCNCAFEKMKAKNLNLDDIKRMQDPSSEPYSKQIVASMCRRS